VQGPHTGDRPNTVHRPHTQWKDHTLGTDLTQCTDHTHSGRTTHWGQTSHGAQTTHTASVNSYCYSHTTTIQCNEPKSRSQRFSLAFNNGSGITGTCRRHSSGKSGRSKSGTLLRWPSCRCWNHRSTVNIQASVHPGTAPWPQRNLGRISIRYLQL